MRVGVIFGGASVEHDVSIITALQAMAVLSVRHLVVPIYITRAGRWLSGDNLRDIETYRTDVEPNVTEVYRDLSDGVIRPLKGKRGIFVILKLISGTFVISETNSGISVICRFLYRS